MAMTRRQVGFWIVCAGALLALRPLTGRPAAQEQAPNRPEFTIVARDFRFAPDRIEASQGDLIKVTIRSEDVAYSFAIDEYRIVRRVPAGASTTFEFRADRAGTFRFYSNLTSDPGHRQMEGRLVVRGN